MNTHKTGFWRRHIADQEASGLSQAAYCRQHKLKAARLSYWMSKLAAAAGSVEGASSRRFVPVQITPAVAVPMPQARCGGGVRVVLPDGTIVESAASGDISDVAILVAMLRGRAP